MAELVENNWKLWASRWEDINYMDTCQHLDKDQFFTTTDTPLFRLSETVEGSQNSEVGRNSLKVLNSS